MRLWPSIILRLFFLSKALYLHLTERGATGAVINMVDAKIEAPTASRPAYYISKGGIVGSDQNLGGIPRANATRECHLSGSCAQ